MMAVEREEERENKRTVVRRVSIWGDPARNSSQAISHELGRVRIHIIISRAIRVLDWLLWTINTISPVIRELSLWVSRA